MKRASIDSLSCLPLEEREGWKVLHGLHSKPSKSTGTAQPRASSLNQGKATVRARLLGKFQNAQRGDEARASAEIARAQGETETGSSVQAGLDKFLTVVSDLLRG